MRTIKTAFSGLVCLLIPAATLASNELFRDAADFDAEFPPQMVEVSIPSHGHVLTGTYYSAAGPGPHPTIVTLHAFPGYEKNLDLAQALRRAGFNILYFDYRGTWGGPAEFSVASGYEDAESALAWIGDADNARRLRVDPSRISLLGHSFGAVAALHVGGPHRDVTCVVSLAPEDMTLMIDNAADQQSLARYTDNLRVVTGYSGQDLIDDLKAHRKEWAMTNTVTSLGDKPYLLIGGALDSNFDASEVARIEAAAREAGATGVTAEVIEYADHSFSARRIELITRVAAWLGENCGGY